LIRNIVNKIRASIRAVIIVICIPLYMLVYFVSLLFRKHTKESAFRLRRAYVSMAYKVMGMRIEVKGKAYEGAALYVSNHRSFSDPIVASLHVDAFVIAKAEVGQYPLINKGAELTGIIYVKRENKESRKATREAFLNIIRSGYNVLVYPEGTVNYQRETMPYKIGTFLEAAKNNIPVVPIAIEYQDESDLWKVKNFLVQFFRQFGKSRTYIKMEIGPAFLDTDGVLLKDKVEKWTNTKLAKMQDNWSNVFTK